MLLPRDDKIRWVHRPPPVRVVKFVLHVGDHVDLGPDFAAQFGDVGKDNLVSPPEGSGMSWAIDETDTQQ